MWGKSKPFALLLLCGVVSLFFFHLTFGSFQSTHGPTTPRDSVSDLDNLIAIATAISVAGLACELLITQGQRRQHRATDFLSVVLPLTSALRC